MLEFTPVDERVASLRLRVGDRVLTVVGAYAPNSSSDYPPFLESLGQVLERSVVRLWCGSQSAVCLVTGDQTLFQTHLNNSTHMTDANSSYNLWLGLTLALLSAFLIGGSVILKKKALLRLADTGHTRAGDGGHGYLKDWLWWGGLLTSKNLAVLSSYLLGEVLNVVGKLGCLLCVLGSILLVLHAPEEQEVTSLQDMTNKLLEPGFLVYVSVVLVLSNGRGEEVQRSKKEDKYGLMDNMVIESLPPMREEGPRVFIIS
ncbi:magnesium transporter NIPA4-like [Seriola lalandi dorsalis]|uniref:magnesium transporter NIPA4-like n=1 Tax=Seriola lalandi dorsalis TaxID=1841481 RepID=UPI000C6FAA0A|nr:magnesium transporter NIPA4-like [Seriola lalandi dorsalis]